MKGWALHANSVTFFSEGKRMREIWIINSAPHCRTVSHALIVNPITFTLLNYRSLGGRVIRVTEKSIDLSSVMTWNSNERIILSPGSMSTHIRCALYLSRNVETISNHFYWHEKHFALDGKYKEYSLDSIKGHAPNKQNASRYRMHYGPKTQKK